MAKDRSHITWPAVIVLLLVGSMAMMLGVLAAATSDGGARVVDNYYSKAARWDSIATMQRSGNALSWSLKISNDASRPEPIAILTVLDPTGSPVSGIHGQTIVSRPQLAAPLGTHTLVESMTVDGQYSFEFPYAGSGLWDITVDAAVHDARLNHRIRIEL